MALPFFIVIGRPLDIDLNFKDGAIVYKIAILQILISIRYTHTGDKSMCLLSQLFV